MSRGAVTSLIDLAVIFGVALSIGHAYGAGWGVTAGLLALVYGLVAFLNGLYIGGRMRP